SPRRPTRDLSGDGVESDGVVIDEIVIEPIVLDHQMEDAVKQRYVAPGLDWQKKIASSRHRCDARVNDNDLRPVLTRLPDIVSGDRRAFGDIGAADPDDFGFENVRPRISRTVDAEGFLVTCRRADPAQ